MKALSILGNLSDEQNRSRAFGASAFARGATLLAAFALAGCGITRIVPAEDARPVRSGSPAVFAESDGIRLIARTDADTGPDRLPLDLIAVQVVVNNASGRTIYDARNDVALVAPGRTLLPQDPTNIRERVLKTTTGLGGRRLDDTQDSILAAPVSDDDVEGPKVKDSALPEGPIENGRSVRGFVYFSKPSRLSRLDLEVTLRSAPSGPALATLRIPFRVEH